MSTKAKQQITVVAPDDDSKAVLAKPVIGMGVSFNSMKELMDFAGVMATAKCAVPQLYLNNPGACLAVTMQAIRWGMDPFQVAQKTHEIQGVMGYEAQLINAVVTAMAPTTGRLQYEWYGPWENVIGKFEEKTSQKGNKYTVPGWGLADEAGCGIRVYATMKGETEPRVLDLLLSQAGVRNSTLWATDPKQQLAYLATKRWARLYCPDVILGVYSPDELQADEREIGPGVAEQAPASRTAAIKDKLKAAGPAPAAEQETPPEAPAEPVEPEEAGFEPITYAMCTEAINQAENAAQVTKVQNTCMEYLSKCAEEDRQQHADELRVALSARKKQLKLK